MFKNASNLILMLIKIQSLKFSLHESISGFNILEVKRQFSSSVLTHLRRLEISHSYQLDQSISVFRVVWWYIIYLFKFLSNQWTF